MSKENFLDERFSEIRDLITEATALSHDIENIPIKIHQYYSIQSLILAFVKDNCERLPQEEQERLKSFARSLEFTAKTLEVGLAFEVADTIQNTQIKNQKTIECFNLLADLVDEDWQEVGHLYEKHVYKLAEQLFYKDYFKNNKQFKWEFHVDHRSKSWLFTIEEQRRKINKLLNLNPSLKPFLPEAVKDGYEEGLALAIYETSLEPSVFPKECLYSLEEILGLSFFPGIENER